jgi:hypothetical protein
MSADTHITLEELHATITAAIQTKFPALQTVEFYREDRDQVEAPACLLELCEFEGAPHEDPGTGQFAVMARFEADLVLGFRTPAVKLSARVLAASLATFINEARWPGGKTGPAEAIHAYKNDFKPHLDKYEVWTVEWRQIVHLGESIWNDEGITPTTVFIGVTPEVGPDNIEKYTQIAP